MLNVNAPIVLLEPFASPRAWKYWLISEGVPGMIVRVFADIVISGELKKSLHWDVSTVCRFRKAAITVPGA